MVDNMQVKSICAKMQTKHATVFMKIVMWYRQTNPIKWPLFNGKTRQTRFTNINVNSELYMMMFNLSSENVN